MRPPSDLASLLPQHKHDTGAVRALAALGFPAVEPVMPQLLEWVQDVNWPVAQPLLLFLNKIGAPLAPYIRAILETDDEPWKWNVLWMIVEPSKDLRAVFRPDLERLANNPSAGERTEGLDVLAREILNLGDASH